ncbi:MAG: class IV adenylate cyclase [Candidatus Saccharibacteria bacterium]|jgi:adenylate cyclase class 2|nr:class IV adenylate cyclase [Candidatus Saccharibacteria bacterium]MCA9336412.1 class IV adenylate cyclase [Candidatus Saccharibacteria bacterium]MCA9339333.1 class IV adenylate cyclase [Candidatus Saccharibacteria bacterium]HPQ82713.1 class IV adenylate cyclase [Candidatus Saccharimonas sp.]
MKTEIEVKFINITIDAIQQRLLAAGAVCEQPMRLMRRALMETPDMAAKDAFLRLRDEGNKVTLTYKQHLKTGIEAANEIETTVDDFDAAKSLLEASGMIFHTYQESRRETWKLRDVEVVIDEWPWMPPYIEIEGDNEASIREAAAILGFSWDEAVFGGVDVVYRMVYPAMSVRGVIDIPLVRFDDPVPQEFGAAL